jgi:predicted metalloprotease with PDZ domain
MTTSIRYRIDLADAAAHRYHVTLTVPAPARDQVFSLPVWIPGSYMVREFGRHLSGLVARQGGREVPLTQLDKTSWRAEPGGRGGLTLEYDAYAFDTSVRTAYLDDSRGFFNATSLCLRVHGQESHPHEVRLAGLPSGWEVATAMPPLPGVRNGLHQRRLRRAGRPPFRAWHLLARPLRGRGRTARVHRRGGLAELRR